MTGTEGPALPGDRPALPDDPARPPQWPLELLADLHAGALTKRVATRLRPQVVADPQARTVLAALDNTIADLAALPTLRPVSMPDAVAQRIDAALAVEALAVGARAEGMRAGWRSRRSRWVGAGVLAAAVMGVAVLGVQAGVITGTTPRAGDALGAAKVSPAAPLALSGSDLSGDLSGDVSGDVSGALNHTLGARDYGPLSRPETLRHCLDTNDVPVRDEPLGAREVTLDGRRGVLLVLPTTRIGQFRLLVVGSDCGPGRPSRMADAVVRHH